MSTDEMNISSLPQIISTIAVLFIIKMMIHLLFVAHHSPSSLLIMMVGLYLPFHILSLVFYLYVCDL